MTFPFVGDMMMRLLIAGPEASTLGQGSRREGRALSSLRQVLACASVLVGAFGHQNTIASDIAQRTGGQGMARERSIRESSVPLSVPGTIAGKVVHVADGDTLTLLDEHKVQRIIRLSDIDAPESGHGRSRPGQPYAAVAAAHLSTLAFGKDARAMCYDIDTRTAPNGSTRHRYVCHLTADSVDVGLAMVDAGLAMVYRAHKAYVRNPAVYAHEDQARAERRGLWQDRAPIPPWQWRKACWQQSQCATEGS